MLHQTSEINKAITRMPTCVPFDLIYAQKVCYRNTERVSSFYSASSDPSTLDAYVLLRCSIVKYRLKCQTALTRRLSCRLDIPAATTRPSHFEDWSNDLRAQAPPTHRKSRKCSLDDSALFRPFLAACSRGGTFESLDDGFKRALEEFWSIIGVND